MISSIRSALNAATGIASRATPAPRNQVAPRRNSFKELFEGTGTYQTAQTPSPFSPPGVALHAAARLPSGSPALATTRSAVVAAASGPPSLPAATAITPSNIGAGAAVPSVPGMDLSMYTVVNPPVSLQPLRDALQRAGLSPDQFQFTELQSFETFPTRPDLSYTNRQILIQGPHGAGLFDLYWALRSPGVTAIELRSYGIA